MLIAALNDNFRVIQRIWPIIRPSYCSIRALCWPHSSAGRVDLILRQNSETRRVGLERPVYTFSLLTTSMMSQRGFLTATINTDVLELASFITPSLTAVLVSLPSIILL